MRKSSEATIAGRMDIRSVGSVLVPRDSVKERWVYSVAVFFFYAVRGTSDSLDGPALADLAKNMGCDFEQVSGGVAVYSMAHCISALFCELDYFLSSE